jgi:hypothetical protein
MIKATVMATRPMKNMDANDIMSIPRESVWPSGVLAISTVPRAAPTVRTPSTAVALSRLLFHGPAVVASPTNLWAQGSARCVGGPTIGSSSRSPSGRRPRE